MQRWSVVDFIRTCDVWGGPCGFQGPNQASCFVRRKVFPIFAYPSCQFAIFAGPWPSLHVQRKHLHKTIFKAVIAKPNT